MELDALAHLMNRAGFGLHPADVSRFEGKSTREAVRMLFADARSIEPLHYLADPRPQSADVSSLKVLKMALKSPKDTRDLNLAWLDHMAASQAVLREKMTLFWHNHFATGTKLAYLMQVQNNTLRTHALGNFKDLLHAVARDPVMILYLNNQQNKRKAPNENFAREVMELFTLGEGNGYTERDIKEAARAFTGWHINGRGDFELNTKQHDTGSKTIFGYTGHWGGEDVVELLLDQRQTAHTIAAKFYRFFVNEEPDSEIIHALGDHFYDSEYDIADLVETVFTSTWFYEKRHRGALVKSPTHLLVQTKRLSGMEVDPNKRDALLKAQEALGQVLFFPPNVAGWPGGRAWIDGGTLLTRMRLPGLMLDAGQRRAMREDRSLKRMRPSWGKVPVTTNWRTLESAVREQGGEVVLNCLITAPRGGIDLSLLNPEGSPVELTTTIMGLPEFQLA